MDTELGAVPRLGPLGYGMAPVAVAGGVTLLCALGLLGGGVGLISNAFAGTASPPGIHAAPVPGADVPVKIDNLVKTDDGTGTSTAGPTAPPERGSAPKKSQSTDTVHYIQWGDTLSQISVDTSVSVDRLAEYNSIPNVDLIYADAILHVPYILIPADGDTAAPSK